LNFDRTHNLIVNLAYITPDEFGPKVWGVYPFDNIIVSVNSFARSGRPYTSPDNNNDINGVRSPAEYNTNLRLSKTVRNLFGMPATLYVEVFNLFNDKIFNYNYLFNTNNKTDPNLATVAYAHYAFDDRNNGVLYWDSQNTGGPYAEDHSFMLYDNSPRSFHFGLSLEF
jgi:hypothetical protein